MEVIQVDKKVIMGHTDIVRFQILTHCILEKISVSDADLDCLTLLALNGKHELQSFCELVSEKNIFKSIQTVRNVLAKVEKKGLIVKDGKNKKKILINPALKIQVNGTILLDYKFLYKANAA